LLIEEAALTGIKAKVSIDKATSSIEKMSLKGVEAKISVENRTWAFEADRRSGRIG
jgi:hypothetical protein